MTKKRREIHYMTKSMWTPAHRTSHSKIMGINMELVPHIAAITGGSTLLGRLSTRCWNIAEGTCFHSTTRPLGRSGTDVGRLGLACSRCSNSSQKVFKFLHTDLDKLFLSGPRFVHGDIVMLKQEKTFPKLLPRSWKHRIF